ncbi:hypothetical protein N8Z68_04230 [Polaribacter sp.]|nr:hypothetical protein [Polaribacter sp.]
MKKIFLTAFFMLASLQLCSQDLLDILEREAPKMENIVSATFKGTRIVNGHSIENRKKQRIRVYNFS